MRILHILNHIEEIGNGIVNATVDLACTQATHGHVVAVASHGGKYETLLGQYGVKHFQLNQTRKVTTVVKALIKLRRIVYVFEPDVVHAHMLTGAILAKITRGRFRYKLVTTVHNEFQKSAYVMKVGDRIIAVSSNVASSLVKRGFNPNKVKLVLNGTINSPRINRTNLAKPLQHPAILTVAGLYYRKGIQDIIQAFEILSRSEPQAHLYIVGDGPNRLDFEKMADSSTMRSQIHFEGFQPDPFSYMVSTDVFVLASHKEPFGLVLTEARAAGCAIIASNVDGIPEALDDGRAGKLVPPGNSELLAQEILALLHHSESREKLKVESQNGLDKYFVTRVCAETVQVYQSLSIF